VIIIPKRRAAGRFRRRYGVRSTRRERERAATRRQALDAQRRRLPHWGLETAASATGTQGACDAAAGALADKMPLRQAIGGDRSGPDAGGVREACDRHRPSRRVARALVIISPKRRAAGRFRSRYGVRMHAPRA